VGLDILNSSTARPGIAIGMNIVMDSAMDSEGYSVGIGVECGELI
jgi:hypothetical protein